MIKKIIVIIVIMSFISVSTFATVRVNSDSSKKDVVFSKKNVQLNDQELEALNGNGVWGCIAAAAAWIGACLGASEGWGLLVLAAAYMNMKRACSPFAK